MDQINYTIGDEIVCVDDDCKATNGTHSGLKKGSVYRAIALSLSPCCGLALVDVGRPPLHNSSGMVKCPCGDRYADPNPNTWLFRATRFTKALTASEEKDMEESLNEIAERKLFA